MMALSPSNKKQLLFYTAAMVYVGQLSSWVLDTVQVRQERHEYPIWVTDRWDAENWRECLLQLGCDRTAIERFLS